MSVAGRQKWLLLFSFLVVGGLIYSNTFDSSFHYDDAHVVSDLSFEQMLEKCKGGGSRLIAHLSFLFNYWLHDKNVLGYHIFNILIHIGSACFLFAFLCLVLSALNPGSSSLRVYASGRPVAGIFPPLSDPVLWPAFLGAMLFLVHPLATQAVTYIAQRYSSLAGFFYIGSLVFFVKARIWFQQGEAFFRGKHFLMYACSVFMAVLAMRTKEMTITLPAAVLLTEYYFVQPDFQSAGKRMLYLLPLLTTGLIIPVSDIIGIEEVSLENVAALQDYTWGGGITRKDYLLTQLKIIVGVYLKLLVWPAGQNVDHDYVVSKGLFDLPTMSSLVFICLLLGLGLWLFRRSRLISFGILWFFVTISPTSSIVPNTEFVAEHRAYISMMGIAFAAAGIPAWQVRWKRYLWVLVPVLLLFSGLTYARNGVWKTDLVLWTDSALKSPNRARPQYFLGFSLDELGRFDEAMYYYLQALKIYPDHPYAHNSIGNIMLRQGDLKGAISHYQSAVKASPGFAEAHNNIGLAMFALGNVKGAIKHYMRAIREDPEYAKAFHNLGDAMAKLGNLVEAVRFYQRALEIEPDFPGTHYNLANALYKQGDLDQAVHHYYQAVRNKPDFAEAYNNLGLALVAQGKAEEAVSKYSQALRIRPDFIEAHNNIGSLLMSQGNLEEAIGHFSVALRIKPGYANARHNLDVVLRHLNKGREGEK